MFYVYVLSNERGRTYLGYSADLKSRLAAHNGGRSRSTRGRNWRLIYYEAFRAREDAKRRERRLKRSGKARKLLKERIKRSLGLERK
jgi:putative endonuclease